MSQKLSQEYINQLANEPDSDIQEEGNFQKEVDQEYPEEFIQDVNNEVQEEYKIQDEPEIQSEIASENIDEVSEHYQKESDFRFKKEDDLSQAQSEFIQSSRLNDGVGLKIKSTIKSPKNGQKVSQAVKEVKKQVKNLKVKQKKQAKVQPQAKQKVKSKGQQKPPSKKIIEKKKQQKISKQVVNDKEKLSQSQINRKMKEIEEEKNKRQQRKDEQKKKQDEVRRKQYQQAKQKEQQRKEKNKKILEEQKANKKKPNPSKLKIQQPEQQIKIPQKPVDFKYMDLKKQKMRNEKLIQKQIQEQNLLKLRKLNNNRPSQLKGQAKKIAILQERKSQLQRQKKQKANQQKEQDVLIIKQIKKQIMECKRFNLQKNQEINRAEKNIDDLKKKIKEKEKIIYLSDSKEDVVNQKQNFGDISQLSPIQKFVYCFPQAKTVDQIFNFIDQNGDGVLSSKEIVDKLTQFNLQKTIINKIQEILDQNCDGTVTRQQFVFLVQLQMKRQKDLRQILGNVEITNPMDMQQKIIDMQGKIKYINRQIQRHKNSNQGEGYRYKFEQLQKKAEKIENKIRKEIVDYTKEGNTQDVTVNTIANLTNQYVKLTNQKTIKLNFLQKLRTKVKDNLEKKNRLLGSRVEENLRLQEQVYKIKNQIQQRELRFLSLKKMEENKKGYIERQTKKRRQLQEAYKRTKEYQILIADPAKKAQKSAQAFQMKFLAAVLMIQRNYRKKKARRQFQKLKGQNMNK